MIKAQIRIADGEKLKWKQEDIQITGHAIECRINAEDPSKNFRPCPGRITDMYLPGGKVFVLTVQSTVDVKYPHTMIL